MNCLSSTAQVVDLSQESGHIPTRSYTCHPTRVSRIRLPSLGPHQPRALSYMDSRPRVVGAVCLSGYGMDHLLMSSLPAAYIVTLLGQAGGTPSSRINAIIAAIRQRSPMTDFKTTKTTASLEARKCDDSLLWAPGDANVDLMGVKPDLWLGVRLAGIEPHLMLSRGV